MDGSTDHGGGRDGGRSGRRVRVRVGVLGAGLAAVALLAGACGSGDDDGGGKGVANVNPSASAPAGKKGPELSPEQIRAAALAYSKCMRQKGVAKFPDPDSNGGISINGNEIQQNSPQFRTANDACKNLLPAPPPGNGGTPQDRAAGLKYSQCMRSHGVTKFPDPNEGGGLDIDVEKLGMDPNGPVFKAAEKACQKFMGGSTTNQKSGPGAPANGG